MSFQDETSFGTELVIIQSGMDTRISRQPASSVPKVISEPRSTLSSVNRLLKAAEGFQLFDNPIPEPVQDTVSLLGAGFASYNIGAELYQRNWMGALEDTASGSVSLLGGVKLITDSEVAVGGLSVAGALLNGGLAVRDIKQRNYVDAGFKLATAAGLGMTAAGGGVAESVGLTILGVSGLANLAYDHLKNDDSR